MKPSSPILGFRPSHFWTMWTLLAATVDFVRGISAIRRIAHCTSPLASRQPFKASDTPVALSGGAKMGQSVEATLDQAAVVRGN